ncbi:hypothetical protein BKA65DRAFT_481778 [Rhexocercosporidium sp. MPI-PUGE-AT-0058]|nr:hypothetical protein BKA65DRAFT_481778 [Rhexocercosporidium sp. MPI-PUGE-AT-0058]
MVKQKLSRPSRSSQPSNPSKPSKGSSSSTHVVTQALPDPSPYTSFLFVVNGVTLNEDTQDGGIPPRTDHFGRWLPPAFAAGFGAQTPGTVFRWSNGDISTAAGYAWDEGYGRTPNGDTLEIYKATTMFWCNPFYHFMVASGDATTRNLDSSVPEDTWYAINFHHDEDLSRVDYVANQDLVGNGRDFIADLGLNVYRNTDQDAPRSGGLAGNLAILIGLVAFSCKRRDLNEVLVRDRAWRGYRWHGHNHSNGRTDTRGMVVSVYRDPDNPDGSTEEALDRLEWNSGYLLK